MANVLGMEITDQSVRGALVRTSARRRDPVRYLDIALPQLGEEGSRQAAVQGAVRELLETLTEPPDAICVAMPGQHVSLRTAQIPEAAAKRAAEVLPFELESQLPFPVEDAIIDYQPVGAHAGQMRLLTAVAPADAVGAELEALAQVGLDPRELVPGAASLDGLTHDGVTPDEPWLVAHVEHDHTDLCILRNGRCELARTLDEGLDASQSQPATLRMSLVQTVSMYRAEGGPALTRLVVSGSGGNQPSFVDWLGELLQLPAEAALVPGPEGDHEVSPIFGKAYALAARSGRRERRLNMRRGPYATAAGESFFRRHAATLAACAAALMLAYVYSVWAEYSVLVDERDALAERLHEVTKKELREPTRSASRARQLLERVGKLDDPLPEFDAMQALGVISDAVERDISPHDVRRLEIQLDDGGGEGTFELSGSVPDLASRDKIASALEEHECIGELEKGRTSSLPGKDAKTYALEGTLTCSEGESGSKKKKSKRRGSRG